MKTCRFAKLELIKEVKMRGFIITLCCVFIVGTSFADPPRYGDGKPTTDKVSYCQKLVKRFGHRSQRINDNYYGIGVKRPNPRKWSLRTKEPSWFSKDLFVIFEQTTKEKYEDFTHRLVCKWEKDSFFTFKISHHSRSPVIMCSWSPYITDEYDCP